MIDKSVGFAWLVEMIKGSVKYALGVQKRTLEAGVQLSQQYCRNEHFCLVCGGSGSLSLILFNEKSRSLRQSSLSWILLRRKFCAACRRPVIVYIFAFILNIAYITKKIFVLCKRKQKILSSLMIYLLLEHIREEKYRIISSK